jgi:hypothetical protein
MLPPELDRRFGAMAAELEELDRRLLELRDARAALIDEYVRRYRAGDDFEVELDAARLLGCLEVIRPSGFSFRQAFAAGSSYAPHIEKTCIEALRASSVRIGSELRETLEKEPCLRVVESYASLIDVPPDEVSHFAISVIAAAFGDPAQFVEQFPDLLEDDVLRQALEREDPGDEDDENLDDDDDGDQGADDDTASVE